MVTHKLDRRYLIAVRLLHRRMRTAREKEQQIREHLRCIRELTHSLHLSVHDLLDQSHNLSHYDDLLDEDPLCE